MPLENDFMKTPSQTLWKVRPWLFSALGLLLTIGDCAFAQQSGIAGPFREFTDAPAPKVLSDLGEQTVSGVRLKKLVFESVEVTKGSEKRSNGIYVVIASPESPGTYPGILLLHGGMGCAEEKKAIEWAKKGYVAVAPDLPGIAVSDKAVNSIGFWKEETYEKGMWRATPNVQASTIFQAVAAAIQSFNLLKSQPGVDTKTIGIHGISWGGYTTTALCGILGNRVKAGFSIFGCGHYEDSHFSSSLAGMPSDERKIWMENLDAGVYAKGITTPFFIAAAANDFFFWPPAVMKTLNEIPGEKNVLFSPNISHRINVPGGGTPKDMWPAMAESYFDYYLKGTGNPYPFVELVNDTTNPRKIAFRVRGKTEVESASVQYSAATKKWTDRKWEQLPANKQTDGSYSAEIPAEAGNVDWFVLVSDNRPVSVSSEIRSLKLQGVP